MNDGNFYEMEEVDEEDEEVVEVEGLDRHEAMRLYNNKKQRDWAAEHRQRSKEIKKKSYEKNKVCVRKNKMPRYMQVGLEEKARIEDQEASKSVHCEGECEVMSCEDCKWFYALTDDWPQWKVHPYFERMGLPLPAKWASYDPYRPDYESEEAMCGTRCIQGNEHRKHPLLGLLQEAYTFVMLPEPVGEVSGPAAGVRMPSYDQAMAMPCSRLCRARPRTVRAWRSFCNGPWSGSVGYDAYGFCKRCSVLGPATRMREALQEEAEMQLHEAMLKSAKAWQSSFKEGKAGVEWRRQFKAQLQERVQKRAAAGVIAARVAQRQARARYAALV
jgi:hypothetical protein